MILEMRNICKDYPMGKTVTRVLRDVSLDVAEGEYLAIRRTLSGAQQQIPR